METLNLANNEPSRQNGTDNNPEKRAERVFLGLSADGAEVYDRSDSHLHSESGLTKELLNDAIGKISTSGRGFIKEKVEYDHPIGTQTCVEVGPEDEVVMVYRNRRSGQTPMVKNREAEPCNSLMVILKKDRSIPDKDVYEMLTGYIGEESPREPWDPNINSDEEREKSEQFWQTHALLYDDRLIDWEKTKGFEFMSPSTKERELIRSKVLYSGVFVEADDLYSKVHPTLEKPVEAPHITTAFKPNLSELNLDELGSTAKIIAVGYGNNGDNEGLLVKIEADDPVIQEACNTLETPHITLSTSRRGQAKNTVNLEFSPIKEPFEIAGKYGLFAQGKVVFDKNDLTKRPNNSQ